MNPVIENLLTRRSVRAFQEKEIPEAQLEQILEAARYAPSAMARQTWKFTAVVNREKFRSWLLLCPQSLAEVAMTCTALRF